VIPAFADVRTSGTLTDRVELEVGDESLEFTIILADWSGRAQPFGAFGHRRADCQEHYFYCRLGCSAPPGRVCCRIFSDVAAMIKVITIEREYGSGAAHIAATIADRLGWKLWDQEITEEIARRLKCNKELVRQHEERCDSMFYRLMKAFMRGSFEPRVDTAELELLDAEHLAILFEKVVTEIASKGNCVIIGRGSNWFLRDRDDCFHAFLYAPYEEKFRRVLAQGETEKDARDLLETVDRERAAFIKKYYGKEWPDRSLYHVMMNTILGDDAAVESLLNMVEVTNRHESVALAAR
jgi:cytidylate kinase